MRPFLLANPRLHHFKVRQNVAPVAPLAHPPPIPCRHFPLSIFIESVRIQHFQQSIIALARLYILQLDAIVIPKTENVMLRFFKKLGKWIRGLFVRPRFAYLRAAHLRLGRKGENIAARVLQERGMELLSRNYRAKRGELDLVLREDTTLVIAEVKTRHRQRFWEPADAVDANKCKNIIRTTAAYLRAIGSPPLHPRFDIVEVIFDGNHLTEVRHLRNVFQAPHNAFRHW